MLAVFPTLLPEEPVYSAIARYADMMRYGRASALSRAVFGRANVTPVVDLPGGLDLFLGRLLPGHGYTADDLIAHHTALPYYRAFLPAKRATAIAHAMRTGTSRDPAILLGHRSRPVGPAEELRYCADCVAEDRASEHGAPYWRRVHQLAGVVVCPVHTVVLTDSGVDRWGRTGAREFVSLAGALARGGGRPLVVPRAARALARAVAVGSFWLLQHGNAAADAGVATAVDLWVRLQTWMREGGWTAGEANRLRHGPLARAMRRAYAPPVLAVLGVSARDGTRAQAPSVATPAPAAGDDSPSDPGGGWVDSVLTARKSARNDSSLHPLVYLLLLSFLDVSAERFFTHVPTCGAAAGVPVLKAPCGNPVCTAYDPPAPGPLTGAGFGAADQVVVDCPACGFRYAQRRDETDRWRRTVLETGPVWDAHLVALVADPVGRNVNFEAALGLDHRAVQQHAYRLGVWHARWSAAAYERAKARNETEARRAAAREATREDARGRWLALRAAYPSEGRVELHRRDRAAYSYLHQFDKLWMQDHLPPIATPSTAPVVIDWAARDADALTPVSAAVAAIRSREGRPVRVTVAAVGRALRRASVFAQSLEHMPRTRDFLQTVLEDDDAFARRRILLAAVAAAHERCELNISTLNRRVALSWRMLTRHRALVDEVVRKVNAQLNIGAPLPPEWARELAPAPWQAVGDRSVGAGVINPAGDAVPP